jgi:CheY-like chemotaxis protein
MENRTKKLILIVDDEPEIVDIYKTELELAGFDIITAANGMEGIQTAKEKMPDLILMDFKMPGMDGIETFTRIHNDPATKDIKVVFLSAFGDSNVVEGDVKAAKDIGALDFLKKGTDLEEIVAKVKEYAGVV